MIHAYTLTWLVMQVEWRYTLREFGRPNMSDESLSTTSVIKMKLLTWFSGYTVVSRTKTASSGLFGSSKHVTEWCLAKPATTEPHSHAAETSVTDPVCGTSVDAAPEDGIEYVCPMNPKVEQTGPGNCRNCGAPLKAQEAYSEPQQDSG